MVSESICLEVLHLLAKCRLQWHSPIAEIAKAQGEHVVDNAADDRAIYCDLLGRYKLSAIDDALRWLQLAGYINEGSGSIRGPYWRSLSDKGLAAVRARRLPEEDKKLLYQEEDPYAVFIAHQFNPDDAAVVKYIRERVLKPAGLTLLDGRADGLEDFRSSILAKIKRARFFLCLLTKRVELASGSFASSVWLYQETGVAVAYGKKPLLLVEDGIDSQYVGELQSIYEHIVFTRSNHPDKFDAISRRFLADLAAHHIPAPATA